MFKDKPKQTRSVGKKKTFHNGRGPRTPRTFDGVKKARRSTRYIIPPGTKIEYKNIPLLQRFVTERGKIVSRRLTGASAKQQRALTDAVKKARFLGFLSLSTLRRAPLIHSNVETNRP